MSCHVVHRSLLSAISSSLLDHVHMIARRITEGEGEEGAVGNPRSFGGVRLDVAQLHPSELPRL